jgi:hypothetical protein
LTFRRIDSFATDDPAKLADQLPRLEDNIAAALSTVVERLLFTDWVSSGTPQLAFGRVLRADTSVQALSASLPSLSPDTIGRTVGVKVKGGNSVDLFPVETTALIDGAASATLSVDGLYLYTHDGAEWSQL